MHFYVHHNQSLLIGWGLPIRGQRSAGGPSLRKLAPVIMVDNRTYWATEKQKQHKYMNVEGTRVKKTKLTGFSFGCHLRGKCASVAN